MNANDNVKKLDITKNTATERSHNTTSGASKEDASSEGSDPVMVSPNSSPRQEQQQELPQSQVGRRNEEAGAAPSSKLVENDEERFEDSMEVPEEDDSHPVKQLSDMTTKVVTTSSFVTVGLQRKASVWELKNWIALSLTLDGRDKITKVLQYVSRFLGWWFLAGVGGAAFYRKNQSIRFTTLYKALANSRKAFRLGRSITEAHKIATMGLVGLVCWHIQQHLDRLEGRSGSPEGDEEEEVRKPPKTIIRRASSNIGWGPMTLDEDDDDARPSLARTMSGIAYRKMYRPLLSRVSSTFASTETPAVELWKAVGTATKMLGLLGFWLGDNVNFLTSNGAFDNYKLSNEDRLARRKRWATFASQKANQAYFVGAVAGLLTNAYAYYRFQQDKLAQARSKYEVALQEQLGSHEIEREEQDYALKQLKKVQEKQFSLFLALLKSCVDVTVFSNNPGVDLHKKWRGSKNNEGLHCLCGLISAGTVLFNNFPDAKA
mmetsp:Transcript_11091/g.20531  ORF Transcript_11091/g.20531 Transcript_11091/m.20531 type:complete len:490 (-) Transcript_11091:584-2053(-)